MSDTTGIQWMRGRSLTPDQANVVWDVLVSTCDANERDRWQFVHYVTDSKAYPHEWRFIGCLGFGGKLWLNGNRDGAPHVTCYQEDETPMRAKIMEATNAAILAALVSLAEPSPKG